jgi:hypothetical protein
MKNRKNNDNNLKKNTLSNQKSALINLKSLSLAQLRMLHHMIHALEMKNNFPNYVVQEEKERNEKKRILEEEQRRNNEIEKRKAMDEMRRQRIVNNYLQSRFGGTSVMRDFFINRIF